MKKINGKKKTEKQKQKPERERERESERKREEERERVRGNAVISQGDKNLLCVRGGGRITPHRQFMAPKSLSNLAISSETIDKFSNPPIPNPFPSTKNPKHVFESGDGEQLWVHVVR